MISEREEVLIEALARAYVCGGLSRGYDATMRWDLIQWIESGDPLPPLRETDLSLWGRQLEKARQMIRRSLGEIENSPKRAEGGKE